MSQNIPNNDTHRPNAELTQSWTQTGQAILKYALEWGVLQMSNHRHNKLPVSQIGSIWPDYATNFKNGRCTITKIPEF